MEMYCIFIGLNITVYLHLSPSCGSNHLIIRLIIRNIRFKRSLEGSVTFQSQQCVGVNKAQAPITFRLGWFNDLLHGQPERGRATEATLENKFHLTINTLVSAVTNSTSITHTITPMCAVWAVQMQRCAFTTIFVI